MADEELDDWFEEDEDDLPRGGPRTGIVVAAVADFVVGALALVGGIILATSGMSALALVINQASASGLSPADLEKARGIAAGIIGAIALVLVLFGLAAVVAGVGVAKRLAWGRVLSMVLAGLGGAIAVLSLVVIFPYGVVIFGAHALIVLIVLNDKDYVYQFR